jgi:hypothetical protein
MVGETKEAESTGVAGECPLLVALDGGCRSGDRGSPSAVDVREYGGEVLCRSGLFCGNE